MSIPFSIKYRYHNGILAPQGDIQLLLDVTKQMEVCPQLNKQKKREDKTLIVEPQLYMAVACLISTNVSYELSSSLLQTL